MPVPRVTYFFPFQIQTALKKAIAIYCQLYLSLHKNIHLANNGVTMKYSTDRLLIEWMQFIENLCTSSGALDIFNGDLVYTRTSQQLQII